MKALVMALLVPFFSALSLADAQRLAVQHSPDVAIAQAKVDEARANFDEARTAYAPSLLGNYALSPQGVNLNQTAEQHLVTVGAQVTLGDLLAAAPQIARANAELRSAEFSLDDARRSEQIAAIDQYYGDLDARAAVDARTAALEDATRERHAAQLRFRSGDAPRLDVVRTDVAVAGAQADLARAQADAVNADAALAQTVAVDTAALTTEQRETAIAPMLPYDVQASVRTALASRPEIAAARADVVAEQHAVDVARRSGLPAVTVQGGYTHGVDSAVVVSGPNANVTMTVPLGGAAHDRVAAEEARLREAVLQERKTRREIALEVAAAVRTLDAQGRAYVAAQRALDEARTEYTATQIGYRSGASSSLDVESARTTYVDALVSQLSAFYDLARARATLALLMGNGHA